MARGRSREAGFKKAADAGPERARRGEECLRRAGGRGGRNQAEKSQGKAPPGLIRPCDQGLGR